MSKKKQPLLGVKLGSGVPSINWKRDAPFKHALPEVSKKIVKSLVKHNDTQRQAKEQLNKLQDALDKLESDVLDFKDQFAYYYKLLA